MTTSHFTIDELHALCERLGVEASHQALTEWGGGDPRVEHLLLSALMLAGAERHQFVVDQHAQQAGLDQMVEEGAYAILSVLDKDPVAVTQALAWRCGRDALLVAKIGIAGSSAADRILAAASHAVRAAALGLTMAYGLVQERQAPGSTRGQWDPATLLRHLREVIQQAHHETEAIHTDVVAGTLRLEGVDGNGSNGSRRPQAGAP